MCCGDQLNAPANPVVCGYGEQGRMYVRKQTFGLCGIWELT